MLIEITIKDKNVKVSLKEGEIVRSEVIFAEERALGEKILPAVDKMLKENQLGVTDVEKVLVFSDQSDSFTTTRIAKTFANSWNWGKDL